MHERALAWPKTARSRLVASQGLARLGKSAPDMAEALLPRYAKALEFNEADRGRVLYQIALWTVASYLPDSARRLNAVPASAYDERLHEWRVREAMARSDWKAALVAIRKMGAKQRGDSRWTYFQARLMELTGDKAGAQAVYRKAAREAEFHGFLAADRIDQPYALCPRTIDASRAQKNAVARDPAMVRAMALHALDRDSWAVREWNDALSRLERAQYPVAVEIAQDHGWFDRAVFTLGKDNHPKELQLYTLRFPLHHDAVIRREAAKNDLDPAWVAAEIRAESVFNPTARSGANAMGLMQVLPTTGMAVARRIGVPWNGAQSLYDPTTNIVLGTAYLRQMLDRYGGQPYFASRLQTPSRATATLAIRTPGMDPDFWIETLSYRETREYVARVREFSTLYTGEWRQSGAVERAHGRPQTAARASSSVVRARWRRHTDARIAARPRAGAADNRRPRTWRTPRQQHIPRSSPPGANA